MASLRQGRINEPEYSLFQLLKPEVVANPYPLYKRLREYEPVHWDPYMHSWVVTSYAECVTVLTRFKAGRTPSLELLETKGLSVMAPYAEQLLKQILFVDPPLHTRLRTLCGVAFTQKRMAALRAAIEHIGDELIDKVAEQGSMELMSEFAGPFPARVMAALLGLPAEDCLLLKKWSSDMTELIGNFEHNPDRMSELLNSLAEMNAYLTEEIEAQRRSPGDGAISAFLAAEANGERMAADELLANVNLMIAGGIEEPANLIGAGMLALLRQPEKLQQLKEHPEIVATAAEELVRLDSPTQNTGRIAAEDVLLGDKQIRKRDLVTVSVAGANRDPLKFDDPDTMDLTRQDNRHLSYGWGSHYCIGAPIARMTAQAAFNALLRRLPGIRLTEETPTWRRITALRGLASLSIEFDPCGSKPVVQMDL